MSEEIPKTLDPLANLIDELSRLKARRDELLIAATEMIDFDQENECPVCHCCGMELDEMGRGHRNNCLADKILNIR